MAETTAGNPAGQVVWPEERWRSIDDDLRRAALSARDGQGWSLVTRQARAVMRAYTTSFFIVSRFLPRHKRDMVEVVYATVRYPDEVVDCFPLAAEERMQRIEAWAEAYEKALQAGSLRAALEAGVPCFLAGFAEVVRRTGIPAEHYRAFLDAMRLDVRPRPFQTLDDLIDSYIYGSAIVVGYFLTHIYGASAPGQIERALRGARELGIALQLTNFLRDVAEDQRRGRVYLPVDMLQEEGIRELNAMDPAQQAPLDRVVKKLAARAADYYARAEADLDAFAEDSRVAIKSCIDVYGLLNQRILSSSRGIGHRESVPMIEKLRPLPASKYWRIPLAYLGT